MGSRTEALRALRGPLLAACREAAAIMLPARERLGGLGVERKHDGSPVSEIDHAASAILGRHLGGLLPGVPVVCEEARRGVAGESRFWLVDPLDGTREFLRGGELFSINIALIEEGAPVFGMVHLPARGLCYHGGPGLGAWRDDTPIRARRCGDAVRVVLSPGERATLPARYAPPLEAAFGSVAFDAAPGAIKFGWLAEGSADLYPRHSPSCGWDSAAGHALLRGAGGTVFGPDGRELRYRESADWLNPDFLAVGDAERDWPALLGAAGN